MIIGACTSSLMPFTGGFDWTPALEWDPDQRGTRSLALRQAPEADTGKEESQSSHKLLD